MKDREVFKVSEFGCLLFPLLFPPPKRNRSRFRARLEGINYGRIGREDLGSESKEIRRENILLFFKVSHQGHLEAPQKNLSAMKNNFWIKRNLEKRQRVM